MADIPAQKVTNTNQNGVAQEDNSITKLNKMILEVNQAVAGNNQYQFQQRTHRTMVTVGRARTGKSTLARMLQEPLSLPEMPSLFSDTKQFHINQLTTTYNGNSYSFSFVDSPGFFEAMRTDDKPLSNQAIKELLDQCITKDVTQIHAFAFVLSAVGGLNVEDIESMKFIKKNYPDLHEYFILIVTHCEEKDQAQRQYFVDEFFQHPTVIQQDLRDFFGLGIFFTGSLRPELRNNSNVTAATDQANNVLQMRATLLDFLISREQAFNIHYTPASTSTRNSNVGNNQLVQSMVSILLKGIGLVVLIAFVLNFIFPR